MAVSSDTFHKWETSARIFRILRQSHWQKLKRSQTASKMIELIETVRKEGDSIGGAAEIVASNIPAGLGEPVFDKIKADLGKALFSLPAVLAVEYGIGFGCVTQRGSRNNDLFRPGANEDAG